MFPRSFDLFDIAEVKIIEFYMLKLFAVTGVKEFSIKAENKI